MKKLCSPQDLFQSLVGKCGGGVLGTASPPLPDDPDFPSTCPSVNGLSQSGTSCSRSPETVGVRSPDAPAASLRGLVYTVTPGTTTCTRTIQRAIDDVCNVGSMWVIVLAYMHLPHIHGENTAHQSSKNWTVLSMSKTLTLTAASSAAVIDPVAVILMRDSFDFRIVYCSSGGRLLLLIKMYGCA